jgi:hypothetical protein
MNIVKGTMKSYQEFDKEKYLVAVKFLLIIMFEYTFYLIIILPRQLMIYR